MIMNMKIIDVGAEFVDRTHMNRAAVSPHFVAGISMVNANEHKSTAAATTPVVISPTLRKPSL